MSVARSAPLPCGRYLLAPSLTENKECGMKVMVPRVRPTRFSINVLFNPVDSTSLHLST